MSSRPRCAPPSIRIISPGWFGPPIVLLAILASLSAVAHDPRPEEQFDSQRFPRPSQLAAARPWDLSVRVFAEYDDNVPLRTENDPTFTGKKRAVGVGAYIAGEYRFVQTREWTVGFGGSAVQSGYLEDDVNAFNLTSLNPRLFADYNFDLMGKPATFEAAYVYYRDWLDGHGFLQSHMLQADLGVRCMPALQTNVYYHLRFDDFDTEGPDPAVTSRDAMLHIVGAKAAYTFDRGRRMVMLNYEFQYNDADGKDFVFNAHKIGAQFITQLIGPVSLGLEAAYTHEDYTDFTTSPRRKQDNQYYRAVLFFPVTRNITGDVYYSFEHFDGRQKEFDADRSTVGAGLTYKF